MITGAMRTGLPKPPKFTYIAGRPMIVHPDEVSSGKRPTSLMIHLAGHGPRRIYRVDWNARYFYILRGRKIFMDYTEFKRVLEMAGQ